MRTPFALAILMMVMIPGSADAQQQSGAESDVWTTVKRGWDALRAENVDDFMATFHPQFLGWSMSRPATLDYATERSGTVEFFDRYDWVAHEIDPVAIRVVDDIAIVHYRYREVVRDSVDGEVHEEKGRATQVLKRQGDQWKTLTIMSGSALQ